MTGPVRQGRRSPWLVLHRPSVVGRARADRWPLLLAAAVVALSTLLVTAVPVVAARTADRAVTDAVQRAGTSADVVVTAPFEEADPSALPVRDPRAAESVTQDAKIAQLQMPEDLAAVLRTGVGSVSTTELHLVEGGPGRYLRLAYVAGPAGPPAVRWVTGRPPAPGVPAKDVDTRVTLPADVGPWTVQVGLSQAAADALGVTAGDRLVGEDSFFRQVLVRVSGVYTATSPRDAVWAAAPQLLDPSQGRSENLSRTSATALVTATSLPDLRLAVPYDDLDRRVVFTPQPRLLHWRTAPSLAQGVTALKASSGLGGGSAPLSWDSLLDGVLHDALQQVAAARAQAAVVVVGLLTGAALVLLLAAQLLVARRASTLALGRQRGASLTTTAAELLVEAVAVAALGTAVGVAAAHVLAGGASPAWVLPVLVVAVVASPLLGVLAAARATGGRRVAANRSARRAAARVAGSRRLLAEAVVVLLAVAAVVALRQRGVLLGADQGVDLLPVSAPAWCAVAGGLVVLRLLPVAVRSLLRRARRSRAALPLVATAGLTSTAVRVVPFLVVVATTAQLTLGVALATTERHGQSAGAWREVGADARLQSAPDQLVAAAAGTAAAAPGVRSAVAARVADGVSASSPQSSAVVRLVVVDARAWARLLTDTPLGGSSALRALAARGRGTGASVPALVRGGDPALRDGLRVRWQDTSVPLDVVGAAPVVGAGDDPVVVVDAAAFATTGLAADPSTVWAVGPGAGAALDAVAGEAGAVVRRDDVLARRQHAPLAEGLVRLALVAAGVLLLLGALGVALAAAVDAPGRARSLARLRTLGLGRAPARRVLAGQVVPPVLVAAVVGLVLGAASAFLASGRLRVDLITGQVGAPDVVVPWWSAAGALVLVVVAVAVAAVEAAVGRREPLGQVLRAGGG